MNYIITTTDGELYHYGILGQKWGVRRYQNPDGTLTEEGKKRYGSAEKFEEAKSQKRKKLKLAGAGTATAVAAAGAIAGGKKLSKSKKDEKREYTAEEIEEMRKANIQQAIVNQYNKNNKKEDKTSTVINGSKDVVRTMKDLNMKFAEKTEKEDLSKYSDAELQKIVNRMNLEQRYYQLKPQEIDKGARDIDKILDVANGVLTVTGTAVALYAALKR